MSPAQQVGQLLMIGVPIDDPASAISYFESSPIGGIFLEGRSSGSASDIAAGIAHVQSVETPISGAVLHVSVDQEGGQVQSLRYPDFPVIPDAVHQGSEEGNVLKSSTVAWARRLTNVGVTLDLAPVADTVPAGTESDNPPIGRYDRQYGSTPGSVAQSITDVIVGMRSAGLGTTVKHFPGLGRVTANTDTSTDAVDDKTTLTDSYLEPFAAAIKAGTTAVMVSSARYPNLDTDHIAAFSPTVIQGLLRGRLGFQGLVVSDDMGNAVAVDQYSPGERAVKFIEAGGDMVLSVDVNDFQPMTTALTTRQSTDPSFAARIRDAALHVLASKKNSC